MCFSLKMSQKTVSLLWRRLFTIYKMQTDSVKYRNENSTDSVDSCAQIQLSKKENSSPYTMGASLGHIWKGGYFNNSFPPVYQYPFAEWIPNSICYADFVPE